MLWLLSYWDSRFWAGVQVAVVWQPFSMSAGCSSQCQQVSQQCWWSCSPVWVILVGRVSIYFISISCLDLLTAVFGFVWVCGFGLNSCCSTCVPAKGREH